MRKSMLLFFVFSVGTLLLLVSCIGVPNNNLEEQTRKEYPEYSRFTEGIYSHSVTFRSHSTEYYLIDYENGEIVDIYIGDSWKNVSTFAFTGNLETGLHLIKKNTGEPSESFFIEKGDDILHYDKKWVESSDSPYHRLNDMYEAYELLEENGYDGKQSEETYNELTDVESERSGSENMYVVIVDTGRIRKGPSTDTETVCLVHRNDILKGTGNSEKNGETIWYEVYYGESCDTGWASEIVITQVDP